MVYESRSLNVPRRGINNEYLLWLNDAAEYKEEPYCRPHENL